jgi:hypothetical protein
MAPRPLRRLAPAFALAGTLALTSSVQALPLLTAPEGPAALRAEAGGLLTWLGQVFTRLWAEDSDTGPLIDPDGNPLRPNGSGSAEGDTGKLIDPNG